MRVQSPQLTQASVGLQALLRVSSEPGAVPAGAEAMQGTPLKDCNLNVAGI